MAWPTWLVKAYLKRLYRRVQPRLDAVQLAVPGATPRLALITSCGVHRKSDPPFDIQNRRGDPSFREIGVDDSPDSWTVTHGHYDNSGVLRDYGICLPIQAVRYLVEQGELDEDLIGS